MQSYRQLFKQAKGSVDADIRAVDLISKQLSLPTAIVRKGIKQGLLRVGYSVVKSESIYVKTGARVKFGESEIDISTSRKLLIDKYIDRVISEIEVEDINRLAPDKTVKFCAYVIEFVYNSGYEEAELVRSSYHDVVFERLESLYKDYFKGNSDGKIPKRKELVEVFVRLRSDKIQELVGLSVKLLNGVYNQDLYKFLQEYTRIINSSIFTHCISANLNPAVYSRASLESIIKPIAEAEKKRELDEKFEYYQAVIGGYESLISLLDLSKEVDFKILSPIYQCLLAKLKTVCETVDPKSAEPTIIAASRKYNFSEKSRLDHELFFSIQNNGKGLAREVKILRLITGSFHFEETNIGILKPDETREFSIDAKVTSDDAIIPKLSISCQWFDSAPEKREKTFEIVFQQQDLSIPWEEMARQKPYTIQEIDEKSKLFGRDEILEELLLNVNSNRLESYKIWGQKRVGKSSIVKTLKTLLRENESVIVVWRKISILKNIDPIKTLNSLGESLCSEIFEELELKIKNKLLLEKIKQTTVPVFDGSLYPLEDFIKRLKRMMPELKFLFILDEFDGINEEFFLPGRLGDTLSQNMGKGLNESDYISFILVGSENMQLLDKQSMNYNSFKEIEVGTFSKEHQFNAFERIVKGPVTPYLNYFDDSVDKIFTVTNGNPYFANLICSNIFKFAMKNRDSEIDSSTTGKGIDLIINSSQKSHFDHFWSDGIGEDSSIKKERKTDIRRRILISYSYWYFQTSEYPNRSQIIKGLKKPLEYSIEQFEIENTITEFINRRIFVEDRIGTIRIKPPLFESWLCGPGRTLMSEGISDLEALRLEQEKEESIQLRDEELKLVGEKLPFRGEKIPTSFWRKFFNQFGGPVHQRRVFNLIDGITYISKEEMVRFFQREQKNIFKYSERKLKMGAKTYFREGVIIYSMPDTLKENIELVETFKKVASIRTSKTLKDIKSEKNVWKHNEDDEIIIFENVFTDCQRLENYLLSILSDPEAKERCTLTLVTLVMGVKAKIDLIKATSSFSNFKYVYLLEIDENKISPFSTTSTFFETKEEALYALSEVRKFFPHVDGSSLTILLEYLCPSKSLPIFWASTKNFEPIFPNAYGVLDLTLQDGEKLRQRLYEVNTRFSQKLNSSILDYLKWKARKIGVDDWFNVQLIPAKILTEISNRWIEDRQTYPKESYFSFIHYKEIIKMHNQDLGPIFQVGQNGLEWCDKLNILRRDPAHPEKPAPKLSDVEYYETVADELIRRMLTKLPFKH